ncbi:hypothetical protein AX774_g6527 [Zancudomyces culisetae]|uniref:PA domain-containing protein n=1 Tax=Zancudomyces culisetae TaxID=1213189 RepID=A0A1R1PGA2_ZANCU|nr:hypothetical protein AX774_g6527 [Zancudomyces culisetae]|eukprot:OMH80025.1 hypothetical protein AX774_g6527 [Zancudomyces culisetae]
MEVYPRITENKEYLEDQQLADTCQWPRCGDARMSRISVLDLFHYYRTGSAEGTRLTDGQVACLGSLDYVTSLPLRKDFDLVKLLVWPTAEVSGEKNSGVGKIEWMVEGGIVPFSERNRVELGMVFGLQCSAPGVHDIPKIATKPIPKEVIKSQLEQAMERTKSLANVWAEPNIVRFPVVPHLLMRSDGHLFTKYQQRLFGQLTRQGIRHQLDLNLTDFSKLSDSTLPISPEFMYSIKQNTSISFTNGALPLVTDLTYIRLCVEISNPASLSSLGVKIREDQRALHLNSGASLPKFDVCKEYIGRLARFSMRHTLYTSLKVVDDQTQIVIPHFLAGRTSLIFGCEHYTPREVSEIKDKIVMVVKGGGCSLYDKVVFAQEAGAKAILISDDSDVDLEPTADSESGYVDPEVDSSVESSGSMAKLVSDKYRYGGLLSIDFPSLLESRSKKPVLNLGFQLNSEFNQDLYEEGEPKKDEKPLEKNISDMVHDEYESEENIDAFKAGFQSDDKKKDRHSESENLNVHKNPEGAPGNKFLYSPDKKAAVNNESVKEQSEKDTPAPPSKKPDSSSSSSHTSLSNRRLKNKIDHQQLIPSVYVYKEFFELVAKHISNRNIVKASIV